MATGCSPLAFFGLWTSPSMHPERTIRGLGPVRGLSRRNRVVYPGGVQRVGLTVEVLLPGHTRAHPTTDTSAA